MQEILIIINLNLIEHAIDRMHKTSNSTASRVTRHPHACVLIMFDVIQISKDIYNNNRTMLQNKKSQSLPTSVDPSGKELRFP